MSLILVWRVGVISVFGFVTVCRFAWYVCVWAVWIV